MAYWGATYLDVAEKLQGSNEDASIYATTTKTAQVRIEQLMDQAQESILGKITDTKTLEALQLGRFNCHQVIFQCQNAAQTAVDVGQEFPGTVDEDTFRIQQNAELAITDSGLASDSGANWDITTNVLTISQTKALGDIYYAYYSVDPLTIASPQLATLLITWAALQLYVEEVGGGSGDDGGISDAMQQLQIDLDNQILSLQENTSIAKLLKLRMCEPFTNPNTATTVKFNRC